MVVSTEKILPPSRVWSEGGCADGENPPSRLSVREGRRRRGFVDREPLRLAIRAREGLEGINLATRRRERHLSSSCRFCCSK